MVGTLELIIPNVVVVANKDVQRREPRQGTKQPTRAVHLQSVQFFECVEDVPEQYDGVRLVARAFGFQLLLELVDDEAVPDSDMEIADAEDVHLLPFRANGGGFQFNYTKLTTLKAQII
jgi:hypothetical protein